MKESHQIKTNHITTDDMEFSAYLKMKGHRCIKSEHKKLKTHFTDLVTGLMWQKSLDRNDDGVINYLDKLYYREALDSAASCSLAGHANWRLPTIKELYSLIMFSGVEPRFEDTTTTGCIPFIDTIYFNFGYGSFNAAERILNA